MAKKRSRLELDECEEKALVRLEAKRIKEKEKKKKERERKKEKQPPRFALAGQNLPQPGPITPVVQGVTYAAGPRSQPTLLNLLSRQAGLLVAQDVNAFIMGYSLANAGQWRPLRGMPAPRAGPGGVGGGPGGGGGGDLGSPPPPQPPRGDNADDEKQQPGLPGRGPGGPGGRGPRGGPGGRGPGRPPRGRGLLQRLGEFNLFGVRAGRGLGGAGPGGSSFLFGPANNLANAPGLELGNLAGRPAAQPEEEKEEQKQAPPSEPPLPPLSGHNNVGGSFIASANSVIGNAMNIASNAANAAVLGAAVAGAAGSIPLAVTGAMIGAGANSLSNRISNIVFGSSKPRSPEEIEMKDSRSKVRQQQDALLNLESNAQYKSLVAGEPIKQRGLLGYDKTDAKSKFNNEVEKYKFLHNGKRYIFHRDRSNKETFISEDGDVVEKENSRFRAISQSNTRHVSRLAGLVDEEDINEADEAESEESPLLGTPPKTPPKKMQKNFLQRLFDNTAMPDDPATSMKKENEPEEKKQADEQSRFLQMTVTKTKEGRIKYGHTHDEDYYPIFNRTMNSRETVDSLVEMDGSKEARQLYRTADPDRSMQYSNQVPLHRINREYGLNEHGILVRLDNPLIPHPSYGSMPNVYRPRTLTSRRSKYNKAELIDWLNNQSKESRRRFYQQATIQQIILCK